MMRKEFVSDCHMALHCHVILTLQKSSQTKKLYLATSKISQTFTLNTVIFKDAGISSSLPTDSNPNGSTATEVFSISSKKQ